MVRENERIRPMDFKMNPDLPRQLQEQIRKLDAAMQSVFQEHRGADVAVVRSALQARVSAVGNGASITEPDLTNYSTLISRGKRVWIEADGSIKADE